MPEHKVAISMESIEAVKFFYQRDDISRRAPGRKDVVTVRDVDGVKMKYQARHLTSSVAEVHALFHEEFPLYKIGKSKFAELRPQHVLLSSKLPHNVCLCRYHENKKFSQRFHCTHTTCLRHASDDPPLRECWLVLV